MRSTRKNNSGLTFLELMIVISILAVIGLSFYGMLSQGLRVWRTVTAEDPAQDIAIFFDKFTVDAHNSLRCKGLNFVGAKDRVELVTKVFNRDGLAQSVGKAVYTYDAASHQVLRFAEDYSEAYDQGVSAPSQVLPRVRQCRFKYLLLDPLENTYLWKEEAAQENGAPRALRMEIVLEDGQMISQTASLYINH